MDRGRLPDDVVKIGTSGLRREDSVHRDLVLAMTSRSVLRTHGGWTVWSGNCCDHRVAESNTERRGSQDRRQHERRKRRIEHLESELEPLRASVKATEEKIRELEREQRTQLVRIAQMQQELIELKKSKR